MSSQQGKTEKKLTERYGCNRELCHRDKEKTSRKQIKVIIIFDKVYQFHISDISKRRTSVDK